MSFRWHARLYDRMGMGLARIPSIAQYSSVQSAFANSPPSTLEFLRTQIPSFSRATWNTLRARAGLRRSWPPVSSTKPFLSTSLSSILRLHQNLLFQRLLAAKQNESVRQFHSSTSARYDRLQSLEEAANRDRDNPNTQAIFLQVIPSDAEQTYNI